MGEGERNLLEKKKERGRERTEQDGIGASRRFKNIFADSPATQALPSTFSALRCFAFCGLSRRVGGGCVAGPSMTLYVYSNLAEAVESVVVDVVVKVFDTGLISYKRVCRKLTCQHACFSRC